MLIPLPCFRSAVVAATLLAATAAGAAAQQQPGSQSRWSLDFRVRLEQHSGAPVEVHLTGDLVSTVAAVRPAEYDAQLQIDHMDFTGDAVKSAPAGSLEDLRQRLSRPFWATYRADGGLLATHFYREVSPADRNLLQMVATELQLVRPDAAQASWTAQERDGAGEYMALYVMEQPGRIVKRKLKYIYTDGVANAPADTIQVVVDEAGLTFSLGSDGGMQTADGTSRMRVGMSLGSSDQLATVTEIHARNLRRATAPELIGSLAHALPRVNSSSIVTYRPDPKEAQVKSDERLIEGYTTESLLESAYGKAADSAVSERLAALFRRHPEAASRAVALLAKNGAQRRITDALGVSGSTASIAALATLARNSSLPQSLRVDAIVAFIQMQHPVPEAMAVPAGLMLDPNLAVRSAARMISGGLARAGRTEHAEEAQAIDATLVGLYKKVSETGEATELLGALGNSAGPATIPVIEEALHDARIPVRAAAARALRWLPGYDIDQILAYLIASDTDASVRADAIFAARFRRPMPAPIANALLHAATVDSIDYVRSNAVSVLRQNPMMSPQVLETLSRIAESDKNPGIRRQALDALAAISESTSMKR